MNRFEGRVAIITGAGAGIGRATAALFAEQGATVVVAERDPETGREAAEAVVKSGGKARFVATEMAEEDSVREMVKEAAKTFGRINVLVNNAAVFVLKGIDGTPEDWRRIMDVNVVGAAMAAKYAVPEMRKVGKGAIVNLGSISSFIAQPKDYWTYNAAKGAIAQLTRCMALDLAPDNIRVNAVCPGAVWTQIVQRLTREQGMDRAAADASPDWGGAHMLKRIADPIEIAHAIAFLASDEASFITAANLMVDGGYTAR